ncbi:MAG: hypothetical protein GWN89_08905 [Thermoplasmata archaeon]|nr:hypothetical protein [Thermoplasmata archaeon]NIT77237.1 hypothetical protein [Thermoplasmata archaeon]NIY03608.1 hypothetical protein [Thermoplasmata archaeon]
MKKAKPVFTVSMSAEEVVHLEAALDFAVSAETGEQQERLTAAFGVFEDNQSEDLMYDLWRGFSKLRDDVMECGGLDDE